MNYKTVQNIWDGVTGQVIRALGCFANDSGSFNLFYKIYPELPYNWAAGDATRLMLEEKLRQLDG